MPERIRPAQPDETGWVAATIRAAFRHYVERIGREPGPMKADFAALVAAGDVHVFEAEGERLGLIVLRAEPDHLFVDILAVSEAARRRGIGRKLMGFAEAEARRLGLPAVRLYTNAKMTENRRFYPALGYRELEPYSANGFERVDFEKRLA